MSTTQPIRNRGELESFKEYYRDGKPNIRNYALIMVCLNTALRINDTLHLTYDMVFIQNKVRKHIVVRERKTGKENRIFLNDSVREVLGEYRTSLVQSDIYRSGNQYLFPSPREEGKPLSRYQAYRIIHAAAEAIGIEGPVSCHSLRKTFGYHAWRQGKDPMAIMMVFNHSSLTITKRYLCLEQDDKDAVFRETTL